MVHYIAAGFKTRKVAGVSCPWVGERIEKMERAVRHLLRGRRWEFCVYIRARHPAGEVHGHGHGHSHGHGHGAGVAEGKVASEVSAAGDAEVSAVASVCVAAAAAAAGAFQVTDGFSRPKSREGARSEAALAFRDACG